MTLRVLFHDQLLFEAGTGEGMLVPFDEGHRALAVQALASALAALSGIKPRNRSEGVEVEFGPRCPRPAPETDNGVVVLLREMPSSLRGD